MSREKIRPYLLPGILILGALLRVGYGLARAPRADEIPDPDRYVHLATTVAESWSLTRDGEPTAERMPAYPLLLGALFTLCAKSYALILLANVLLSVLALFLLYRIGRTLFSERVGFLAAAVAAVYPQFIFYAAQPLRETFTMTLSCLLLWALVSARGRPGAKRFALAGAAGALLALANSIFIPFALVLVPASFLLFPWKKRRDALRWAGIYLVAFLICFAPWPIRNRAQFGRWIVGSTVPKYSILYSYLIVPQEYGGTQKEIDILTADPVFQHAGKIAPAEREAFFRRAARKRIRERPLAFARLFAWRFLWDIWRPIPRKRSYAHNYTLVFWASLLSDGWIIPLGFLGMLLTRLRPRECAWIYLFVFSTAGGYSMFLTLTRYRLTTMPWLILFAAAMLARAPISGLLFSAGSAPGPKAGGRSRPQRKSR